MGYPGSKGQAGVFQRIIGQMPPHSVYVEPFLGSGQVFLRKRPARINRLCDRSRAALVSVSAAVRNAEPGAGVPDVGNGAGRGNRVFWHCGDAVEWLPSLSLPADAVVYCDPPYLLSTRKGRVYYEHEMDTRAHERLLTLLQGMRCRVLLSGYPSELYGAALWGWRCLSYRVRVHAATVTECLWCNFPEPGELHDWRFAGQTFRQRLTFSRLAARWLARLGRMPARKRGFVLAAIEQRYGGSCGTGDSGRASSLTSSQVEGPV